MGVIATVFLTLFEIDSKPMQICMIISANPHHSFEFYELFDFTFVRSHIFAEPFLSNLQIPLFVSTNNSFVYLFCAALCSLISALF